MSSKLLCNGNYRRFIVIKNTAIRFYVKTHYEILKLRRDCSAEDIRHAFLKLSKEYHPDKSNQDTHAKFVKISEAYNVLSKASSRRDYDLGLANPQKTTPVRYGPQPVWSDETFWEYRDKTQDKHYESKPYYGIKGINRISNFAIVIFCIVFTTIGVILQIIAIRSSFTLRRDKMDKDSQDLGKIHSAIRKQALENGNEKQLKILMKKLNYTKQES